MNNELFSVSFRYALKYENSFQIYCIDISGSSRGVAICLNLGRYSEGVQRVP